DQLAEVRILARRVRSMTGRAERRQAGGLPAHGPRGGEEVDVLGVRAWPAALDVGHAVFVEHPGDAQLVGERQRDVLALRAVAERRVVEGDGAIGGAHAATGAPSASMTAVASPVVPTTTSPSLWSAGSARSAVRQPSSSADDTAASMAVAASSRPSDRRRSMAADRIVPTGFALS